MSYMATCYEISKNTEKRKSFRHQLKWEGRGFWIPHVFVIYVIYFMINESLSGLVDNLPIFC